MINEENIYYAYYSGGDYCDYNLPAWAKVICDNA